MINHQIKSNELTLVAPPSSKFSFEKDGFIILYFYFKNNVFSTISIIILVYFILVSAFIYICLIFTFFQTTLRYAHADIENKRIFASVICDKLALDTKDTKKQITELALGNLF